MKRLLAITPNYHAVPLGLCGLGSVWQLSARLFETPLAFSAIFFCLAAIPFLILLAALVAKAAVAPARLKMEWQDPVQSPFFGAIPVSAMLFAMALAPVAPGDAERLGMLGLATGWMLAVIFLRRILAGAVAPELRHSGYFVPVLATGLIGAEMAAAFGWTLLAWIGLGLGALGWLVLLPSTAARLSRFDTLPPPLKPSVWIEIAPPAIMGGAWITLFEAENAMTGAAIFALWLLGMAFREAFLLRRFRQLPFTPGMWSFTFPSTIVVSFLMKLIAMVFGPAGEPAAVILGAAVSLLVLAIAGRSLGALSRGTFLPPA